MPKEIKYVSSNFRLWVALTILCPKLSYLSIWKKCRGKLREQLGNTVQPSRLTMQREADNAATERYHVTVFFLCR